MKAHPEFSHIPVIIFTAYLGAKPALNTYGCDALINKPFDLTTLIETVSQLVLVD